MQYQEFLNRVAARSGRYLAHEFLHQVAERERGVQPLAEDMRRLFSPLAA